MFLSFDVSIYQSLFRFKLFLDHCFLTDHKWLVTTHNFWNSVLLRRSNPPILSGSSKRLRSSSVIWFLPVILGSSCCLTFFSISSIFLNASGVVLVRKLNLF